MRCIDDGVKGMYVPFSFYSQLSSKSQVYEMSSWDYEKNGPFKTRKALRYEDKLLLNSGSVHGSITTSYIECMVLIPEESHSGPAYDYPASRDLGHDCDSIQMPDGNWRHRGDSREQRIKVEGRTYVCSEVIHIRPLLPETIYSVTMDEAKSFHAESGKPAWQTNTPKWKVIKGVKVAVYRHAHLQGKISVGFFKNAKKRIDTFRIGDDIDSFIELLNMGQSLGLGDEVQANAQTELF